MAKLDSIQHEFVRYIPAEIEEGVLYISKRYSVAVHKCCCGCQADTVTPLNPTDWQLTLDGEKVSLHPSIEKWQSPCQSHYWICRNQVVWAPKISRAGGIGKEVLLEHIAKESYYKYNSNPPLSFRIKSKLRILLFHFKRIFQS